MIEGCLRRAFGSDANAAEAKGLIMRSTKPADRRACNALQPLLGAAALIALSVVSPPMVRAQTAEQRPAIPKLMQEPGVAWRAYLFGGRRRASTPADVPYDRTANEWLPPESGIGPITADPAHPFYNNAVAAGSRCILDVSGRRSQ